jgi:hypothetical protein
MAGTWDRAGGRVKMAFAPDLPPDYLAAVMTVRISALNLAKEGWRHGLGAARPVARWLAGFTARRCTCRAISRRRWRWRS